MRKGFTLIELVVAVAIMVMIFSFTGVIFKVSINSHRMAMANAEIMQKFRAITDQLNADFKGLRKDAPLMIWFEKDPNDTTRYDQIMFFADGDFQSMQLYAGGVPIRGNVARIYYGHAEDFDYANEIIRNAYSNSELLARRRHILGCQSGDPFPVVNLSDLTTFLDFPVGIGSKKNDEYEHDNISLVHWKVISKWRNLNDKTALNYFNAGRPHIDIQGRSRLHMLLSQGVGSFKIQWAYKYSAPLPFPPEYRWWPSVDPNDDLNFVDSDFTVMRAASLGLAEEKFGIYFNMPARVSTALFWYDRGDTYTYASGTPVVVFPEALKFTFTLYDSKSIIEGGRTFTHIVYLGSPPVLAKP